MQLDWEKMFKRYVFDDVRTPYFTPAVRLTQTQARYELFVYTIFLGMLFAVLSVASLSPDLPHRGAAGVSAYALSVVLAAVAFGVARHPWAAAYCASAPLAALFYFLIYGFHPNLGTGDKVLLTVVVLVWLRYSWRVLAIVRSFPSMPPG